MFDVFTILMILIASASGMWVLHVHREKFTDFNSTHIVEGRIDSWCYMLVSLSTASSFVDAILRALWIADVGWDNSGSRWAVLWLSMHCAWATTGIVCHHVVRRIFAHPLSKYLLCNFSDSEAEEIRFFIDNCLMSREDR